MEDAEIHNRIEQLVAEEHEFYERGAQGGLNESEHRRLESIKVALDQCWDLSDSVVRSARPVTIRPPPVSVTRTSSSATSSERMARIVSVMRLSSHP